MTLNMYEVRSDAFAKVLADRDPNIVFELYNPKTETYQKVDTARLLPFLLAHKGPLDALRIVAYSESAWDWKPSWASRGRGRGRGRGASFSHRDGLQHRDGLFEVRQEMYRVVLPSDAKDGMRSYDGAPRPLRGRGRGRGRGRSW